LTFAALCPIESDAGNRRGFGKLRQTNGGQGQLSVWIKKDEVIKDCEFAGLKTHWERLTRRVEVLKIGNLERPAVSLGFD
jgi:hypothetical protein